MKPATPFFWVPFFAVALLCFHCKKAGAGLTATETAERFMTAMQFGDYKEASKYASDETADLLKYQNISSKPFLDGFKITREEISGDYARVYYVEEDQSEEFIKLRKEGDAWLVIMTKSELRPNNIFDQLEKEQKSHHSVFDTLTDHEREEMTITAEEFLSALTASDLETAEYLSDAVTESWLEKHGEEEKYTRLWSKGYKVTGKVFIGRTGKIIYSIPGEKGQFQLRMNFSLGTWEVSYDGPEQWEGMEEVAEGVKDVAEEMGKMIKDAADDITESLPK